jgi:hypothetical protein
LCVFSVFFFLWVTYWSSFHFPVFFVCSFCFFFLWGTYWSSFHFPVNDQYVPHKK